MTESASGSQGRARGRLLLVLGPVVAVLGVVGYAVQTTYERLWAPWYMPALAIVGVALVAGSLWQRRSVWRVLVLVLLVLFTGAECAMLAAMRLPAYQGPVAAAKPFPAFETMRADGTRFTQDDLAGGKNSVLVFFRGRW